MKILFLYTELAGYFVSCINTLSQKADEVHIVRWPVNKEAPFEFTFATNVFVRNRSDFTNGELLQEVKKINPDKIICSGWIDKGYLAVCRAFKGKIPTIMSMDNHWQGSARQQVMRLIAPFTLHRCFSQAWVPGDAQKSYALKLGFTEDKICTGFYSADTGHFSELFKNIHPQKKENFPRRIIYAGRYIESKGIHTLWNAFIKAVEKTQYPWELWCLGTGELYDQRVIHPNIRHFGFVQPADLKRYLSETGVFILPSNFEPWGVVVHEMAASGMPLICSDKVGAVSLFLQPGVNGFLFEAGNEKGLEELLLKVMALNDDELYKMGELSHELAQKITPQSWVETVLTKL